MSDRRSQPWVLYGLIAANIAMFVVELADGADPFNPSPDVMVELGASFPLLTLHGEWWRLGSSMFLHFGLLHLAMNMLCLYQARAIEPMFGRPGFVVIYLLAGLGGGIASLIASPSNVVIAGASGAVFGVYGALGAKLVMHRAQFEPEQWSKTMRRLATFLGVNLAIGLTTPSISLSAHAGGFIVGVAVGAALLARAPSEWSRTRRALGLAALGIALTAVGVMALPADADVQPVLLRFDALERAAADTQNKAAHRVEAGEMKESEFISLLDREVIAPYQQLRQDLLAIRDVPAHLRPLFARVDELIAARLAAWSSLQASVAESDPAKRAPLFEAYKRKNDEVVLRVQAVTEEIERLKR